MVHPVVPSITPSKGAGHERGSESLSLQQRVQQRMDPATPASLYPAAAAAVLETPHGDESTGVETVSEVFHDGDFEKQSLEGKESVLEVITTDRSKRRKLFVQIAVGAALVALIVGLAAGLGSRSHGAAPSRPTTTSKSHSSAPTPKTTIPPGPSSAVMLAAIHTMTPASLASLPWPTAALPSPSADNFIKANWAYAGGISDFLSFVDDPITDEGVVLAVTFPTGSEGGGAPGTAGGVGALMLGVFGDVIQERAIMSYEVAFSEDFDFVNGGKLPGLYGGSGTCSGGTHGAACFSIRLMWRAEGAGEVYAYIPEYDGFSNQKREYGLELDLGSWNFTIGAWNTVTEVAVLNSDPGTIGPANGQLEVYYNGNLAFTRSDVVFRTNASVGLDAFMLSSFFGGSGSPFWASKGGWAYFKDFQFFSGSGPSTSSGPLVNATFPVNQ